MAFIKHSQYTTAYERWSENCLPFHDHGKGFMHYLGVSHFYFHDHGFEMTDDAARKIHLLLSPHYKTIIAAHRAIHDGN